MEQNTCIEVVKVNGILRQAFILDKTGNRIAELPLHSIKEEGKAGEQGVVTLQLFSIRVIHKDE